MEPQQAPQAPVPPATPPRGRRRLAIAIAVCCWLYLVALLGLWILLRDADLWWPATLFMFSPRWVLTLPLVLLLPAAVLWRRWALVPLGPAIVLVFGPVTGFCIPWRSAWGRAPEGIHLRLLTCNMHNSHTGPEALDRLMTEVHPDLVAVQEWGGWNRSQILAGDGWYIHHKPGLFLASRFPIRQADDLGRRSMGGHGLVMRYELDTPGGMVTLFNLHLASPRDALAGVIHDREKGAAALEAASALRWEQSERVAGEAATVAGPLLLAGDFNTPPESAIFSRVWAPYTDAFGATGSGWGYTFLGGKVAVRIDHILAGPDWHCDRCWVGPNVGSPHRPVIADLTLKASR